MLHISCTFPATYFPHISAGTGPFQLFQLGEKFVSILSSLDTDEHGCWVCAGLIGVNRWVWHAHQEHVVLALPLRGHAGGQEDVQQDAACNKRHGQCTLSGSPNKSHGQCTLTGSPDKSHGQCTLTGSPDKSHGQRTLTGPPDKSHGKCILTGSPDKSHGQCLSTGSNSKCTNFCVQIT